MCSWTKILYMNDMIDRAISAASSFRLPRNAPKSSEPHRLKLQRNVGATSTLVHTVTHAARKVSRICVSSTRKNRSGGIGRTLAVSRSRFLRCTATSRLSPFAAVAGAATSTQAGETCSGLTVESCRGGGGWCCTPCAIREAPAALDCQRKAAGQVWPCCCAAGWRQGGCRAAPLPGGPAAASRWEFHQARTSVMRLPCCPGSPACSSSEDLGHSEATGLATRRENHDSRLILFPFALSVFHETSDPEGAQHVVFALQ